MLSSVAFWAQMNSSAVVLKPALSTPSPSVPKLVAVVKVLNLSPKMMIAAIVWARPRPVRSSLGFLTYISGIPSAPS